MFGHPTGNEIPRKNCTERSCFCTSTRSAQRLKNRSACTRILMRSIHCYIHEPTPEHNLSRETSLQLHWQPKAHRSQNTKRWPSKLLSLHDLAWLVQQALWWTKQTPLSDMPVFDQALPLPPSIIDRHSPRKAVAKNRRFTCWRKKSSISCNVHMALITPPQ